MKILVKNYAPFVSNFSREEVADFVYSILINDIAAILKKQQSFHFNNDLIALGEQVANGPSIYWDIFENTVEDIAYNKVCYMPEKIRWTLWQNIYSIDTEFVDDEDDEVERLQEIDECHDIAREVFKRLCTVAENIYYEYENTEENEE